MKILLVSEMIPCLPSHDGFRLIPANLIRNLYERHEIHLVALARDDEDEKQSEWPREYCKSVSLFHADHGNRAKLRALTGTVDPLKAPPFGLKLAADEKLSPIRNQRRRVAPPANTLDRFRRPVAVINAYRKPPDKRRPPYEFRRVLLRSDVPDLSPLECCRILIGTRSAACGPWLRSGSSRR